MNKHLKSGCCFVSNETQLDPAVVPNTFSAGNACTDMCEDWDFGYDSQCVLATAYMPMQDYRAGFCPNQALQCGTLFPELLRPYK